MLSGHPPEAGPVGECPADPVATDFHRGSFVHWVGLRENFNRTPPILNGKNHGFL